MGQFQMINLVGLDVLGRGETECSVRGDLVNLGRLGQKKNGGYYDYDERRVATLSPVAVELIADISKFKGMFWADTAGLSRVVDGLKAAGITPAGLLARLAADGKTFTGN